MRGAVFRFLYSLAYTRYRALKGSQNRYIYAGKKYVPPGEENGKKQICPHTGIIMSNRRAPCDTPRGFLLHAAGIVLVNLHG
jgi:hypothetical protein